MCKVLNIETATGGGLRQRRQQMATELEQAVAHRQELDPCNVEDAWWIVCHPSEVDAKTLEIAKATHRAEQGDRLRPLEGVHRFKMIDRRSELAQEQRES